MRTRQYLQHVYTVCDLCRCGCFVSTKCLLQSPNRKLGRVNRYSLTPHNSLLSQHGKLYVFFGINKSYIWRTNSFLSLHSSMVRPMSNLLSVKIAHWNATPTQRMPRPLNELFNVVKVANFLVHVTNFGPMLWCPSLNSLVGRYGTNTESQERRCGTSTELIRFSVPTRHTTGFRLRQHNITRYRNNLKHRRIVWLDHISIS